MSHLQENTNSKRVGLLTLPLSNNYGGILQMIALNEVLKTGLTTIKVSVQQSMGFGQVLIMSILRNALLLCRLLA